MGFWRNTYSLLTKMSLHEGNYESAGFFGVMTDREERKSSRRRSNKNHYYGRTMSADEAYIYDALQTFMSRISQGK